MAVIFWHPTESNNLTPEASALVRDMIAKGDAWRLVDGVRFDVRADAQGWYVVCIGEDRHILGGEPQGWRVVNT